MQCILCSKESIARRLCRNHYSSHYQKGTFRSFRSVREDLPLSERFLAMVPDHSDPSQCWEWSGHRRKDKFDYGLFWMNRKQVRAHRISYMLFNGPILEGEDVLHRCDNPPCVNPAHLFKGPRAANNKDTSEKHRFPLGLRHHATKLTDEEVSAIRNDTQMSGAELSIRFGVNQSTISRIKNGKRRPFLSSHLPA